MATAISVRELESKSHGSPDEVRFGRFNFEPA
jgi:hypothetical protein